MIGMAFKLTTFVLPSIVLLEMIPRYRGSPHPPSKDCSKVEIPSQGFLSGIRGGYPGTRVPPATSARESAGSRRGVFKFDQGLEGFL